MDCSSYDEESYPFVVHSGARTWPCFEWSLQDWAAKCGDTKFTFRIHKRTNQATIDWENEAENYIEATMSQLVDYAQNENVEEPNKLSATECNPFSPYRSDEHCFYSSYNYMDKLFQCEPSLQIIDSIRWLDSGLSDPKLVNNGSNSTIWVGTSGSYTPCHLDTYGYNFVVQLCGKKRWILFPPSDTSNLCPTRIPYEESSIFSRINLRCINPKKNPHLNDLKPRIVELNPGDILFVPRHWWHYVENIADQSETSRLEVCISANTWITGQEIDNSLNECLVQFLARPLFVSYGTENWLNLNADLFTADEALQTLSRLLADWRPTELSTDKQKISKRNHSYKYLEECKFEDIVRIMKIDLDSVGGNDTNEKINELGAKDIVNCILDPEVIDLIKTKLKQLILSSK